MFRINSKCGGVLPYVPVKVIVTKDDKCLLASHAVPHKFLFVDMAWTSTLGLYKGPPTDATFYFHLDVTCDGRLVHTSQFDDNSETRGGCVIQ